MARGHCLTVTLGTPITTKMALIVAARNIFMWSTSRANISASSTYMRVGRSIRFPVSSILLWLVVQENAGVSLAEGSNSSHFNILMNFLCLMTRLGLVAKPFMGALIWLAWRPPNLLLMLSSQIPLLWQDYTTCLLWKQRHQLNLCGFLGIGNTP